MNSNQKIWQTWVDALHHWGLKSLVTTILESTGPLHILGAQVVYLGQPLFSYLVPNDHIKALANLLEDPEQMQAFTIYLQQKRR